MSEIPQWHRPLSFLRRPLDHRELSEGDLLLSTTLKIKMAKILSDTLRMPARFPRDTTQRKWLEFERGGRGLWTMAHTSPQCTAIRPRGRDGKGRINCRRCDWEDRSVEKERQWRGRSMDHWDDWCNEDEMIHAVYYWDNWRRGWRTMSQWMLWKQKMQVLNTHRKDISPLRSPVSFECHGRCEIPTEDLIEKIEKIEKERRNIEWCNLEGSRALSISPILSNLTKKQYQL